ncbi:MAG: hypothetical protein HOQ11_13345 [Gemmatimonadaceae bacterium]|nr:hypothetical protein [Gemmatimonadaceae bacterium]NUQ94085.1 hypothetical protein [Gemmatimonadaceae bacterium]NUR21114.1 hypothetical protein [Gemmatimonadaceae bacterium]NUS98384.1 hypothetical protein [Gemmatimonadaceae bacterium]
MPRTSRFSVSLVSLLLSGAVVACSDVAGTSRVPVSVSVASGGAGAAAVAAGPSRVVTVAGGTNTLVITKAQLVLARIELHRGTTGSCGASDDDNGCTELDLDPMLVDLPVTPAIEQAFTVSIPAGTYNELEAKIRAPRAGEDRTAAFLAAHPEFAGRSVHVEGTFNGTPFVFDSAPEAGLELEFQPPLTVADGVTNNITLHVDLSSWFMDGAGVVVDPGNSANAALIAWNIERSFRAFEDHDRDGIDDHGSDG